MLWTTALACGVTLHPFDEQERLEAKSEDLLDVELFNFRGETFAETPCDKLDQHMVRLTGEEYSVQAEWDAVGRHARRSLRDLRASRGRAI